MKTIINSKIEGINKKLHALSVEVVQAIRESTDVLVERDLEGAKRIRKHDKQINKMRWEIEDDCINLIATMQPVANDLRKIVALLSINTELERIGDYAAGIAKITKLIGPAEHIKPLIDIPRMSEFAAEMVESSIKSFLEEDELAARAIYDQDDDIDKLYGQVFRELISFMIEDPKNITQCTYLLWASHNIERMGDRVTNICERIVYLTTGELNDEM